MAKALGAFRGADFKHKEAPCSSIIVTYISNEGQNKIKKPHLS